MLKRKTSFDRYTQAQTEGVLLTAKELLKTLVFSLSPDDMPGKMKIAERLRGFKLFRVDFAVIQRQKVEDVQ